MVKKILFAVLSLFLLCCKKDSKTVVKAEKIQFSNKVYDGGNCTKCPTISVEIPEAAGPDSISKKLNESIISYVSSVFNNDNSLSESIQQEIETFKADYADLRKRFPEEIVPWEATVKGYVSYQSPEVISLKFDSYMFTGGAHGYGATHYLNFNPSTGEKIDNKELFIDTKAFMKLAEAKFREYKKITPEASINSTGFMFDNDLFSLPKAIGFTPQGLELIYNPYEVASYAEGSITLLFPYEKLNGLLALQ